MSRRHNGEGPIYPVKDGYRGYVWCTKPTGERYRKYVKGKSYDETQRAWLKLRDEARAKDKVVSAVQRGLWELPAECAARREPPPDLGGPGLRVPGFSY